MEYFQRYYLNLESGYAYIITEILFVVCVVLLFNYVKLTRKGIICKIIEILIIWFLVLLLSSATYKMFGSSRNIIIIFPLLIILYIVFLSKYHYYTRIVMGCIFYSSFCLAIGLSEATGYAIREVFKIQSPLNVTVSIIVLMMISETIYLRLFTIDRLSFVPMYGLWLIVIISVIGIAEQALYSVERYWYPRSAMELGFWIIELLSYYMFRMVALEYNKNITLQVMQQRNEYYQKMIQISEKNYEDMRVIRHEIKNEYSYLKAFLENKQYDKLDEFFNSISDKIIMPLSSIDCGNGIVNAILNLEMTKAQTEGISIKTKLAVPSQLPFMDTELCSLISNLLDNAIEACVKGRFTDPVIEVSIKQQQDNLFIRVVNPVDNELTDKERLELKTTKEESDLHGFGTKIISIIAKKYNGYVNYDIRDNQFIADVVLSLYDKEREAKEKYL